MRIELIIIGNEILIGKFQDTNSYWMAKRIAKYGHHLTRIIAIGDEKNDIINTLKDSLKRKPDIIITSGGLGPTFDDITIESIAAGLKLELKIDKNAYRLIQKSYERAFDKGVLKLRDMTKEILEKSMAAIPITNGQPVNVHIQIDSSNRGSNTLSRPTARNVEAMINRVSPRIGGRSQFHQTSR